MYVAASSAAIIVWFGLIVLAQSLWLIVARARLLRFRAP
jgi:hypothetical protein